MTKIQNRLVSTMILCIVLVISGCAVEKVNIEENFQPSGLIRSSLPLNAKLQVFVASEYNGRALRLRSWPGTVQIAHGQFLEETLLDVGKKYFKAVELFDPSKQTDFVLVASTLTHVTAESQNTLIRGELYGANGELINRIAIRGSEASNLTTLDAGIYNSHAHAAKNYYNELFVSHEKELQSYLATASPGLLDVAKLVSSKGLKPNGSGTGFIINANGDVLSNAHVVRGCMRLTTQHQGKTVDLHVRALNADTDIAVLSSELSGTRFARFASDDRATKLGEQVIVIGYPLSDVLASQPSLSVGNISSLAGIENDENVFQITAPVQQGNSGGPLFNDAGVVVGIVQSKLDALAVAAQTGDIPQNVNFAVKAGLAKEFLDASEISYVIESSEKRITTPEVAEAATAFVVHLACYGISHDEINAEENFRYGN